MTNRELVSYLLTLNADLPVVGGIFETTEIESVQEERGENHVEKLAGPECGSRHITPFHRIRLS